MNTVVPLHAFKKYFQTFLLIHEHPMDLTDSSDTCNFVKNSLFSLLHKKKGICFKRNCSNSSLHEKKYNCVFYKCTWFSWKQGLKYIPVLKEMSLRGEIK